MATLEELGAFWASISPEAQVELYALTLTNPDRGIQRMIEISTEQGLALTEDEIMAFSKNEAVKHFILDLTENDEFDDVELNEATLSAVSGGKSQQARDTWGPPTSEWAVSKPGFHDSERGGGS